MSQMGEPREIVLPHVDLLYERCFGVDECPRFKHAIDLIDTAPRIDNMLQDRLNDDAVEGVVLRTASRANRRRVRSAGPTTRPC